MKAIGDLELTAGAHRLEARPAAAPKNAMLDLRRIELRPRKPAPRAALERRPARTDDAVLLLRAGSRIRD